MRGQEAIPHFSAYISSEPFSRSFALQNLGFPCSGVNWGGGVLNPPEPILHFCDLYSQVRSYVIMSEWKGQWEKGRKRLLFVVFVLPPGLI